MTTCLILTFFLQETPPKIFMKRRSVSPERLNLQILEEEEKDVVQGHFEPIESLVKVLGGSKEVEASCDLIDAETGVCSIIVKVSDVMTHTQKYISFFLFAFLPSSQSSFHCSPRQMEYSGKADGAGVAIQMLKNEVKEKERRLGDLEMKLDHALKVSVTTTAPNVPLLLILLTPLL